MNKLKACFYYFLITIKKIIDRVLKTKYKNIDKRSSFNT